MSKTAFIEEEQLSREANIEGGRRDGYAGRYELVGRGLFATPEEEPAAPIIAAPFTADELPAAVSEALAECRAAGFEVVSALPEWVELRIPCDLTAIPPLQNLLARLYAGLPEEFIEAINYAFREMLGNALEYGCRLDPVERMEVRFVRLRRAFICRIKDPGDGFDPARLEHAAVSNPEDDPLRHASLRERLGRRAGGYGILLTSRLVDELVYNERHNELMFVKYLS